MGDTILDSDGTRCPSLLAPRCKARPKPASLCTRPRTGFLFLPPQSSNGTAKSVLDQSAARSRARRAAKSYALRTRAEELRMLRHCKVSTVGTHVPTIGGIARLHSPESQALDAIRTTHRSGFRSSDLLLDPTRFIHRAAVRDAVILRHLWHPQFVKDRLRSLAGLCNGEKLLKNRLMLQIFGSRIAQRQTGNGTRHVPSSP